MKLSINNSKTHIIGKSIEKWTLFRLILLIIGNYIPIDYKPYLLYLRLREISVIIFAPTLHAATIHYLDFLLTNFLNDMRVMFPHSITPKFHFLIYYPSMITKCGPLRNLWCMRFEAKHQYFERIGQRVFDFKNICKTLAVRHQMRLCLELSSDDILKQNPETTGSILSPIVFHMIYKIK